jgi:putative Mg2+ transporter-C (MgtC) family protein
MDWSLTLEIGLKILIAVALGGLIGIEREWSKHPAGLRTHMLVCLGSTTFMLIGFYASEIIGDSAAVIDPTRMAAGIVTGIGFLGAGAIMKEGVNVRGLTTAASIWVVAAIGLCVAVELYSAAFLTTFFGLLILVVITRVELVIGTKESHGHLKVSGESFKGMPTRMAKLLKKQNIEIESMELKREGGNVSIEYHLNMPPKMTGQDLIGTLSKEKDIDRIEWLE